MKLASKKYIFGSKISRFAVYTYHLGDYMKRWCIRTPWKLFRLHRILRSDYDRALHDHPMGFWTILLTGSYTEVLPMYDMDSEFYENSIATKEVERKWLSVRWVDAKQPHRLILNRPVWTFIIAEPIWRSWGFYPYGFGEKNWVSERDYFNDVNEEDSDE